MELKTGENDKGRRLDRVLRKALPNYPLPLLYRLLRQGMVLVNGKAANAQDRLQAGIVINIPSLNESANIPCAPVKSSRLAAPEILWQDRGLLAVNKPCGIAVHGKDSLDSIVQEYLRGKLPASLSFKPGPLHRLDKPSSGIVVFSTSIEGAQNFSALLRERKIMKIYLVLVEGKIANDEIWQDKLVRDKNLKKTFLSRGKEPGAKDALTRISPLASNEHFSLITAQISTGRTHQIRAQAAFHGRPLAGDIKYGGKKTSFGFFLHAWKLEMEDVSIEAPPPKAFMDFIRNSGLMPRSMAAVN